MSDVINSLHAVRKGNKWYVAGGGGAGSPIHTFNSVEEMNAANLADGSIACVPSTGGGGVKVIDLTKYTADVNGTSLTFNDIVLGIYAGQFGSNNAKVTDNTTFWDDVSAGQTIKFKIDASALAEGMCIEVLATAVQKENEMPIFVECAAMLANGFNIAKVMFLISKSKYADGTIYTEFIVYSQSLTD